VDDVVIDIVSQPSEVKRVKWKNSQVSLDRVRLSLPLNEIHVRRLLGRQGCDADRRDPHTRYMILGCV
jgi:hypothetical protein